MSDQNITTAPMSSPTYETFKAQTASLSILYQLKLCTRAVPARPMTPKSVNRGFCVGAQVYTSSSIIGNSGRAAEAQKQFLILLEGEIRSPDILKSVSRYQHAIENAKVATGCWLMPSRMILNIGSVVGYSNNLKHATQWMKLGVNTDVNPGTKKASLQPMAGGPSKINPPNSHPSNPIHKQAMQAQGLGETRKETKQVASNLVLRRKLTSARASPQ